jgi:2-polyprenyl-6-methoxyphenol hydroxylase-like FAD-dependent oxidoreductase
MSAASSSAAGSCCIAGGGPAGMMLGLLLARAGVQVTVLEKHRDFLRDFRGDTIHPSTLDVIAELGLLDAFLKLPHQKVYKLFAEVRGVRLALADFSRLPTRCRFLVLMPQWDFLDFLADQARPLPNFRLHMQHEVVALRRDGARVIGVTARTPDGDRHFDADLVVAADGRRSVVRDQAQLPLIDHGAPIDVLWFSLPKQGNEAEQTAGYIWPGLFFVMIDRGDYWQCAYVIPKGGGDAVRAAGLPALRERLTQRLPFLKEGLATLTDLDQLKLLEVQVNRLQRWHAPGLLCIGDAAHAMSPVAGVGINLAVQDAVAAARLLAPPLRECRLVEADLRAVQRRREWPTRVTQRAQLIIQKRGISAILASGGEDAAMPASPPWPMRMLQRFPRLQGIPARLVGVGVRPEHVR